MNAQSFTWVSGIRLVILLLAIAGIVRWTLSPRVVVNAQSGKQTSLPASIYEFTLPDIDEKPLGLETWRGKVLLIVNVASKCGFTGQYAGLQKLYDTYRERGLVVLGFPSNDFLWQEPGSNAEIKSFCSLTYKVSFPLFAKISVKGADAHPLYKFLTDPSRHTAKVGDVSWNFNKFLVDRTGAVIGQFGSTTDPQAPELVTALESALSASAPAPIASPASTVPMAPLGSTPASLGEASPSAPSSPSAPTH